MNSEQFKDLLSLFDEGRQSRSSVLTIICFLAQSGKVVKNADVVRLSLDTSAESFSSMRANVTRSVVWLEGQGVINVKRAPKKVEFTLTKKGKRIARAMGCVIDGA